MANARTVWASDPAYLKAAFSVLGLSEIQGARHEKKVLAMYAASGHPEIYDDETPWCAAYVGWSLQEGGLKGTSSLRAISYAKYGTALNKKDIIPRGAIAVWKRTGGNHVNFVLEDDGTHVVCLGGNQENRKGGGVTISTRLKEGALAYRMPPGVAKPKPAPKPEPEHGPQVQPKSMATSKIGTAAIVKGTLTTVTGGAATVAGVVGNASDSVEQVTTVIDQAGTVVATTKTVVKAAPEGFWMGLLHVLTHPVFIGCSTFTVVSLCVATWYWRRQHRQAGV